jgi:hypothetical protein
VHILSAKSSGCFDSLFKISILMQHDYHLNYGKFNPLLIIDDIKMILNSFVSQITEKSLLVLM